MIVTGVFILLLLYESGQEEIQTDDIVSLQTLTSQVVGILERSEIDPPTLRPEDDLWIPLDDSTEILFTRYKTSSAPSERRLDDVCKSVDDGAEAVRIPSYPNIIGFLNNVKENNKELPSPWFINVDKATYGLSLNLGTCHQLLIPTPINQPKLTQRGQCTNATIMCSRRRKWNLSHMARVIHKLTLEATKRTENTTLQWQEIATSLGPDFRPLLKGINLKAWEDNEMSFLLAMASSLLTDWTITKAITHLRTNQITLETQVKKLQADGHLSDPNPEIKENVYQQTFSHQNSENWEARITQLERKWARFLLINNQTYRRIENLLEASGFINEDDGPSGLSEEEEEVQNEPIGMGIWRSLCNSFTKSIDITLERQKRSEENKSNESEPQEQDQEQEQPEPQDDKPASKGVIAKISQLYDQVSKKFYTPMDQCVPCWVIVISISGISAFVALHTLTLCILCIKLRNTTKNIKETLEMDELNKETQKKGKNIATARKGQAKTPKRKRTMTYNFLPTTES